jgi:hypothetical protein
MNNVMNGIVGQTDILMMTKGGNQLQKDLEFISRSCEEGIILTRSLTKVIHGFQDSAPVYPIEIAEALAILLSRIYRRAGIKAGIEGESRTRAAAQGIQFSQTLFHIMLFEFERVMATGEKRPDGYRITVRIAESNNRIDMSLVSSLGDVKPVTGDSIPTVDGLDYHVRVVEQLAKSAGGVVLYGDGAISYGVSWPVTAG